jgi:CheY-like chemotaxis protein
MGEKMDANSVENPLPNMALSALVIDDDEFCQTLFSEMLMAQGITHICFANNGRAGLHTLAKMPQPPDLLICDIFMPDMDGIELMNELTLVSYRGHVILISGVDAAMLALCRDIALGNGIKVLAALTKPVTAAVLARAIAAVRADLYP